MGGGACAMVKRIVALAGLLLLVGGVIAKRLDAHPLHSSYAEVTRQSGGFVSISVRLFADDFGHLLDSLTKSSGGQSRDVVANQYLQKHLALIGANGKLVPTKWCGMRVEQMVVWV